MPQEKTGFENTQNSSDTQKSDTNVEVQHGQCTSNISPPTLTTTMQPLKPSIFPGLKSGFTKLTAFTLPTLTTNNQQNISNQPELTFPKISNVMSGSDIKMPIISGISSGNNAMAQIDPELDMDGLVSNADTGDLDLDDLLNEKFDSLNHDTSSNDNKNGTEDDLLREIDQQIQSGQT